MHWAFSGYVRHHLAASVEFKAEHIRRWYVSKWKIEGDRIGQHNDWTKLTGVFFHYTRCLSLKPRRMNFMQWLLSYIRSQNYSLFCVPMITLFIRTISVYPNCHVVFWQIGNFIYLSHFSSSDVSTTELEQYQLKLIMMLLNMSFGYT